VMHVPQTLPMLTINQLSKSFGVRSLFNIHNLALEAGKLYVLTGDNGAGKTTLLRILAGLETADKMSLTFNGETAATVYPTAWRRDMIHVHQHPYLFNTTLKKNIEYGLNMRGVERDGRNQLVEEALAWANLSDRRHLSPKNLSGGERQKLALARARALSPKVLLVDEPTANLDRAARAQIVALLQDIVATARTVLVACHDSEIIDLAGAVRLNLQDGALFLSAPH
jgi:tungstate transport system ATP-binding protein